MQGEVVDCDEALKQVDGTCAGAWIKSRLAGEFGAVALQVPKDFEAYARIFHPASDAEWNSIRWAEVAEACGTTVHRQMQWHALSGSSDPTRDPPLGEMDPDDYDALCEILASHTSNVNDVFFGLCDILAWVDKLFPPKARRESLLSLPLGRNYVVLQGPLSAGSQIRDGLPSLIWPADHSWFVASEVDFDSTVVGGKLTLIEAIVQSPNLEAWRVEPTDSLAADADNLNVF